VKSTVTVREYARLTTDAVRESSLDRAQVSVSAFNWLCRTGRSIGLTGAELVHVDDRSTLRLDNYVGVLETPCGTRIEVLPKIFDDPAGANAGRKLLRRMIRTALDLPAREVGPTDLERFDAPLSEWVIGRFLGAVSHLVKRGVRMDYSRIDETARFLRGQLDVPRQLRLPLGRLHQFEIRHDVFLPDRPENRLLRRALDLVARIAQSPTNWRIAQELRFLFREVPASADLKRDFRAWRMDRLMAHYQPVRPWCELVLYQRMPYSLLGDWHGISMLFPMERLFERYVASWLREVVAPGTNVRLQAASEYLCMHEGERLFRLEPDILIEGSGRRWVLDTKWKRLNSRDRANKYGIGQGDLYQLFAYGMKYLGNSGGELVLIYPRTNVFEDALPVFDLGHGLALHVLPFDLESRTLAGFSQVGVPLVQRLAA
jgi:5-methylcytosine-specific restriction enzyme subunit McrC